MMERKVLMIARRRTPASRRFEANKHRRMSLSCLVLQAHCSLASTFARLPETTRAKSLVLGEPEKDDDKESADGGLKEDKPKPKSSSTIPTSYSTLSKGTNYLHL